MLDKLGNGVKETWGYSSTRQQPISLTAKAGATTLLSLGWGYGADSANNGNVMTATIARSGLGTLSQTFTYDPENRLKTMAEASGWSQTYSYDAFGNRSVAGNVPAPDWTPSALSQYTVKNQWKRGAGDSYDASGNQTSTASNASPGTAANAFSFDTENRMLTANVANTGNTSYFYDGEGRRVKKVAGSTTTVYVYDAGGEVAAEYSTGPQLVQGTQYLTVDALGSDRMLTNSQAAVVECFDYLPFGEEIPAGVNGRGTCYSDGTYPDAPDVQSAKFTGKERDAETGLDYFGARYFSAAQGRFTSPDAPFADQHPEDPQSWNMYAYVRNNPLKNTDPDGRDCQNGIAACGNYILGGAGAVFNAFTAGVVNAPAHILNAAMSPFTSFKFPDAVQPLYTPSGQDQREGVEAANAVMLVAPVAEAGATALVDAIGTGAKVEAGTTAVRTGVQANKAVGDAFRDEVASGLAKEGRGVQTEVTKATPFGKRVIDIEVSDKPGGKVLGGVETKTGNSPYNASQRSKDAYLKGQGYPVNVVRKKPEDPQ